MTKEETEELIQLGLGRELYRFLEGLCPGCETPNKDPDAEIVHRRSGLCEKCFAVVGIEGSDPLFN
jgi:hypothetical protein